jgi:hypothetical protein
MRAIVALPDVPGIEVASQGGDQDDSEHFT